LPDAVIPTRAGPNEAGFNLTLVRFLEEVGANAHMFDTGIAVTPPAGYYTLVVPHSSIVKHNVYLTNSVGLIDPTYTGSINVVLSSTYHWAVNPRSICGVRLCQLLFSPMLPAHIGALEVQELTPTSLGDRGSTDVVSKK